MASLSPSVAVPRRAAAARGGNLKFLVAGGVIVLSVAYLVVMGLQSSAVYFLTVGELLAKGPAAQSQVVRVSGNLVPGTLAREADSVAITFQIADPPVDNAAAMGSQPLAVVYRGGQVPDIVGDNVEIVAEGKLDSHGTFVANSVLAKCPSRLENAPPEERDYESAGA